MDILDDLNRQKELDSSDMYHKIIQLPGQILSAYKDAKLEVPPDYSCPDCSKIKKIVVCGMGGSAIAGDLLKVSLARIFRIKVVKDYYVDHLDEETLVIACSYSGNTEETVSLLRQAIKSSAKIAAVTTGGVVGELCRSKYPIVTPASGYPPRSAIGFLFVSIIKILEYLDLIPEYETVIAAITANLVKKANAISHTVSKDRNIAKLSAEKLYKKIPIIYATNPRLQPVAYRWKCQFNENSKIPAFCHVFSEMNHNEIEGWESAEFSKQFIPIFLSRFEEDENYQKRVTVFKSILDDAGIEYLEFFTEGTIMIEELFSLIYLGDMISYYLAILYHRDPTQIRFIDKLKESLK